MQTVWHRACSLGPFVLFWQAFRCQLRANHFSGFKTFSSMISLKLRQKPVENDPYPHVLVLSPNVTDKFKARHLTVTPQNPLGCTFSCNLIAWLSCLKCFCSFLCVDLVLRHFSLHMLFIPIFQDANQNMPSPELGFETAVKVPVRILYLTNIKWINKWPTSPSKEKKKKHPKKEIAVKKI